MPQANHQLSRHGAEMKIYIRRNNEVFEAAICPSCPGKATIYPASALDAHIAAAHPQSNVTLRSCMRCHRNFYMKTGPEIPVIKTCPSCRNRNHGARVRMKRRVVNINQRRRAPQTPTQRKVCLHCSKSVGRGCRTHHQGKAEKVKERNP